MNIREILSGSVASEPKLPKKPEKTDKASFSRVLKKEIGKIEERTPSSIELNLEELEAILDEVHSMGENLVVEPSFANIRRYKEKITEFLEYVVSGAVDLKTEKGHVRTDFRRSKYTIVHVINGKLDKLASSVLQNQANQLKLLESIGEIQGLLVDLIR